MLLLNTPTDFVGLPHTTCSDAITEISRYTISQPFQPINTRPQPNPVAGNIGKPFDPSLSSIGLGNTSRMTAAQDQSRSSLRPNPNHLTDNKPQHNISATMVHNIKQEVDEEHKQGISSLPANPYSVPAPRNQRHSNAGASRISAPAPQSHFKLPNNSATGAGEIQHKRSAVLSRENDTFTSAPSKKVKVEADTIRADTSFSPTRHGRAPSNPAAAGSDTPANTQVKNETSGKKIVSSSVQGKK
ncbi:hypothetical protein EYC84_004919 [Monilinia fructicola]|uniref:Uncharacterized protein n=1 Tax=Monilinia fructicola TaxID=38448 RepID=A0A5M9K5S9_MONFR|nr:hypothetical protein EYC84_004919 [Monilinia fructicola]